MKKSIMFFLSFLLIFQLIPSIGHAEESIKIIYNGQTVESDVPPKIVNNRVLVPVRVISEALGYTVLWDSQIQSVTILGNQIQINFILNQPFIWKNGVKSQLDVTPFAELGRSYLPIRAVAENLGAEITWDDSTRSVIINSGKSNVVASGQDNSTDESNEDTTQIPPEADQTDTELQSTQLLSITQNGTSLFFEVEDSSKSPNIFHLTNPHRLVIDFDHTILKNELALQELQNSDLIDNVRFSQFSLGPDQVRIVIDLKQRVSYTIEKDNNIFLLKLTPYIYSIMIDPGHGGKDPGAISVSGRVEKDFNLGVALKVNELLKDEKFIKPIFTRLNDNYPTLDERVALANQLGVDMFISIHANALPGRPEIRGTETYYTRQSSLELANIMQRYMLEATGFNDRGIRTEDYRVTKYTEMPAVLLEVGYLTNKEEEKLLYTQELQQRVAEGIVKGIKEYIIDK